MKKKMSREERAEYKGGKYTGGPAEERAEKKKGKRMAMGGIAADPYGKGSERPGMKKPQYGRGAEYPGMPKSPVGGPSVKPQLPGSGTVQQPVGTGLTLPPKPPVATGPGRVFYPNAIGNAIGVNYSGAPLVDKSQQGTLSALQSSLGGLSNAQMGGNGMPALQSMKAGGKVKRMAKGGIVKKTKKMADGGMVATTTAQPKPRGMDKPIGKGMLNKYAQMKERFPTYSWGNTSPTTRGQFRTMMEGFRDYRDDQNDAARAARMASKIGERYSKVSSRFPGYKPTTEGPVDTKDELRTYMRGLGDYRRANPGIRPVRPGKPDVTTQTKRGGGLARKGVGQALARGGLVKANGCAARGKTKGKMV